MFVLNGNADRIVKTLMSCGLTEYESKVYFTLLLTGRSKVGAIPKPSSVPQSKVYWTIQSLYDKGLVDVDETCPKMATARNFEPYVNREMRKKEKEVSEMAKTVSLIKDTVYGLRPMTEKYKGKFRVFEPKYLRRRKRLT